MSVEINKTEDILYKLDNLEKNQLYILTYLEEKGNRPHFTYAVRKKAEDLIKIQSDPRLKKILNLVIDKSSISTRIRTPFVKKVEVKERASALKIKIINHYFDKVINTTADANTPFDSFTSVEVDKDNSESIYRSFLTCLREKKYHTATEILKIQKFDVNHTYASTTVANSKNNYLLVNCTALHIMVHDNDVEAVKFLLKNKVIDVNAANAETNAETKNTIIRGKISQTPLMSRETPLMFAIKAEGSWIQGYKSNIVIVKELLKNETIDVNAANAQGYTALMLAGVSNDDEIVKELLKNEAIDVNAANARGYTALMIWIDYLLNPTAIDILLKDNRLDVNKNKQGIAALPMLRSSDIEYQIRSRSGSTILPQLSDTINISAVLKNNKKIIIELLKKPEIEIEVDDFYNIPLLDEEIINALLGNSNIFKKKKGLGTALVFKLLNEGGDTHEKTLRRLLNTEYSKMDIDVNVKNNRGMTALMIAMDNHLTKIVEHLLSFPGINVNVKNNKGMTALMIMSFSINYGPDIITEIREGYRGNYSITEKSKIKWSWDKKYINLLLSVPGIDVNIKNDEGNTALMIAVHENKVEMVEALINATNLNPALDRTIKISNGTEAYKLLEKSLSKNGGGINLSNKQSKSNSTKKRRRTKKQRALFNIYNRRQTKRSIL
jgi:ankyrin repeat protein